MKLISGYIFVIIITAIMAWYPVYGQISPGELAKVHLQLEGMSNCTQCHILGKKVSNPAFDVTPSKYVTAIITELIFRSSGLQRKNLTTP